MKIVVCIKQVVDITNHFRISNGEIDPDQTSTILNPWDEFAVEAALQIAESYAGEVTAISVGTMDCQTGLRHALAMGCQQANHIVEDNPGQLSGLDLGKTLSAAVHKLEGADLILFGKQSADFEYGMLPALFAQIHHTLLIPFVSAIDGWDASNQMLTLTHQGPLEKQQVSAPLPLVLSINKDFAEPRFPSFMGSRKAKKAEIPQWNRSELGLASADLEPSGLELKPDTQKTLTWIDGTNPENAAAEIKTLLHKEGLL
jgi:electron transfer flavoprotein beta subunit